ncbi:alpha/beta hydrolase [Nocardioides sp. R-C-SC26]|uniref:alpha/beta hydrolase n=1 Tax=Nocardioides sp. R-C-SC26 TaxID=2870414 RepID=UPI001E290989|nr:alpha/beta fold hydrolase [Nocardioides sp. R-C-SC26]
MTVTSAPPATVAIDSHGDPLDAWHWTGRGDALSSAAGRPVVVMAHGFGGTKDSGLAPFADALAAAGCDVVAFDYRGFGASGGTPRQTVSVARQLDDYRAATSWARTLPGVDPDRVVLWGVSLSGGHVLTLAAGRDDVAAVISVTPLVDGVAAGRLALQHHSVGQLARSSLIGMRSRVGEARMIPIVARPGQVGALTLDGALEDYQAIAGPTWRNEIDASVTLELGGLKAVKDAERVSAPTLVQIADHDRSAPPHAAAKAAFAARARVHHYPGDHFDVWPSRAWHDPAVLHQVRFLQQLFG